jgi:lysophospholipase L1-like esterase
MRRSLSTLSLAAGLLPGLVSAQVTNTFAANLKDGKQQLLVAYGTSLTAGGIWVKQVQAALDKRYPGLATIVNSGGSGQYSQWGTNNLESLVLKKKPDAVTIEFGVNDAVARFGCPVQQARTNLESMIDRILAARPECQVILMTTTPADGPPVGHTSYRLNIAAYYEMYREVARKRHLALVDLYPQWLALQKKDKATFAKYVPDTIHPGEEGCLHVVTPGILQTLGVERP